MKRYFLSKEKIEPFLKALKSWGELYQIDDEGFLTSVENLPDRLFLRPFRGVDSVKQIVFSTVKDVSTYPGRKDQMPEIPKRVIFDVKACDVHAIKVFKDIFLNDPDFIDPFIKEVLDNLFIVATDCSDCLDTCFCSLIGDKPYPTSEFDLSLAKTEDGFILTAGSDKGERFLKENYSLPEAEQTKTDIVDKNRDELEKKVKSINKEYDTDRAYYDLVKHGYYSKGWADAQNCVSCGACTNVCPTCYCFGLADYIVAKNEYKRSRNIDSCQFASFSLMAGGGNPRPLHRQHFIHRFNHKFYHFKERQGFYACTGCGRCTIACLGKIDIRQTLKSVDNAMKKEENSKGK